MLNVFVDLYCDRLLVIASFGFALCLTVDSGGHNQRFVLVSQPFLHYFTTSFF